MSFDFLMISCDFLWFPVFGRVSVIIWCASFQFAWFIVLLQHAETGPETTCPMGGNRENNLGDFRFFFFICYGIVWVFGVYIIPKWLIKVPGHIAILFGWFLEVPTFCQNLDPWTYQLLPKPFKRIKKNVKWPLEHIILHIWESELLEMFGSVVYRTSICLWAFNFVFCC